MKKVLFVILVIIPLLASAKEKKDDTPYLNGAVPEVNGNVVFCKGFSVPGKTKEQIHQVLSPWANQMVETSIEAPGKYARMLQDTNDTIYCRLCEWMTFKKKALNLDRARFRFQMQVFITDGHVNITCSRLNYNYGTDPQTGAIGEEYSAEDWISDKAAVNKSNTKLYPKSGKFRRKTVDRMNELFEQAMDLFEATPEPQPVQKKRRNVQED